MRHCLPAVLGLGLGLLLGPGCAGKRRGPVEPAPAWRSPDAALQARVDMAEALVEADSAEAALTIISQLRAEGEKGPSLDLVQARALMRLGLSDDAEAVLNEVIRRHPRIAEAHNQLGVLCLDQRRLDEALAHLERAAHLAPEDPLIFNNLGFALLTAGRPDEAVDVLREALRLDGANHQIRNNLGFALVAADREAEAFRVFRAALPEADARYNLGLGLEMRGDEDAAVDQYVQVVASWPAHQPSLDGLKRLRPNDLHRLSAPGLSAPKSPTSSEEP